MKPLDLAGKRFGRLIALEPTDKRNYSRIVWRCKCDCGKIFEAVGSDIAKGSVTSCGGHRAARVTKANNAMRAQIKKYGTVPAMLTQKKRSSNNSGYKGVTIVKLKSDDKRYKAELTIGGKRYSGPRRLTAAEAYQDRLKLEEKYFPTF
jgi:hypothetical protein